MSAGGSFGLPNLTTRWLMALFLVLATYNPSGNSYYHWVLTPTTTRWSTKVLVGILLLVLNLTFILASVRSLGRTGWLAAIAFCVSLVWALLDYGYLTTLSTATWVTISLTLLGSILAFGVSWSHIRGRLSGQADTNDVTIR